MRRRPTPDNGLVASRPTQPGTPRPSFVIAGPTASGKSALALELADALGGTIINADSLQVYRDLRILTRAARCRRRRAGAASALRLSRRRRARLGRRDGARWRSTRSRRATAQGGCRSWSAAPGFICVRSRMGWRPFRRSPRQIRQEALELYRPLGGAAFRERLAQLDPAGAARLSAGDRQRLVRAFEVVARHRHAAIGDGNGGRTDAVAIPLCARSC